MTTRSVNLLWPKPLTPFHFNRNFFLDKIILWIAQPRLWLLFLWDSFYDARSMRACNGLAELWNLLENKNGFCAHTMYCIDGQKRRTSANLWHGKWNECFWLYFVRAHTTAWQQFNHAISELIRLCWTQLRIALRFPMVVFFFFIGKCSNAFFFRSFPKWFQMIFVSHENGKCSTEWNRKQSTMQMTMRKQTRTWISK